MPGYPRVHARVLYYSWVRSLGHQVMWLPGMHQMGLVGIARHPRVGARMMCVGTLNMWDL